jgi:cytochrome c556
LLEANPADFARRAHALGDASKVVQRAVANKDKDALLQALEGIDRACESCHVTYWYPRDQRAREAAKAAGIIE